ncbi:MULTISPECIES: hypothetical protein [unclassified Ensifer]|uniref:hypothetical protein n=1 Tax=unclassified Ensifer TaxID=2633371 RepID=UPI000813B78D|nr:MULTISPECIES: hypothetical protein [unclassified Ensifer]OCP07962.1 hypothetical protein BC362_10150 [Ensifer sp. LC14]OCP10928.1 hypothetical protein BC374_17815 [Ensifer sp. LC13]OCP33345.1 hypothetical protein BC364_16930 [Ensifer sp. LC499]
MARKAKATTSKRAIAQRRYRQRVSERREPDIRVIDVAAMSALAEFIVSSTVPAGDRTFYNRLLSLVHRRLTDQGYDGTKAKEVLHRRLAFLAKEGHQPDADDVVRKSWSPPLPSNRPSSVTPMNPEMDDVDDDS